MSGEIHADLRTNLCWDSVQPNLPFASGRGYRLYAPTFIKPMPPMWVQS